MLPYIFTNAAISILLAFFAVTFLESGIDKARNPKGNIEFFSSHFKGTIFESIISPLFWILTVEELALGVGFSLSIVGLWAGYYNLQLPVCVFGLLVFLQLFTGQRVAKDYGGASGLLPYVILLLITSILLAFN